MKNANYKFSIFEVLLAPYCFLVVWALSALVGQFTEVTFRLYIALFAIALLSSYPIFLKGKASYWKWIGQLTFMKWFVGVVMTFAVISLLSLVI